MLRKDTKLINQIKGIPNNYMVLDSWLNNLQDTTNKIAFQNYAEAVSTGFLPNMYCSYDSNLGFNFVGNKEENRYIFLGISTPDVFECVYLSDEEKFSILKNNTPVYFVERFFPVLYEEPTKNEYQYIYNPGQYNIEKSKNWPLSREEFLKLKFSNKQSFIMMYDTEKNGKNFSDNVVLVPYLIRTNLSFPYYNNFHFEHIKQLCSYVGAFVPECDKPEQNIHKLSSDEILTRATVLFQLLSKYDFESAKGKDKQLLCNVREQAIVLLRDFYVGTIFKGTEKHRIIPWSDSSLLSIKYKYINFQNGSGYTNKLLSIKDDIVCRSGFSGALCSIMHGHTENEQKFLNFVSGFYKTAKSGGLSDVIKFCGDETEKILKQIEQEKIMQEIKNRKAEEKKANIDTKKQEELKDAIEKSKAKKIERYKL